MLLAAGGLIVSASTLVGIVIIAAPIIAAPTVVAPLDQLAGWLLLVGAAAGVTFTINAFAPARRSGWAVIPSFLLSMFATELAAFHLVWQAIVVAALVAVGALASWAGWLGLALAGLSWLGLVVLVVQGYRARTPITAAVAGLTGKPPSFAIPWRRLLNPFPLRLDHKRIARNVEYLRVDGRRLLLDVYFPPHRVQRRPAIIQVHGGGWVLGDKRDQGVPILTHLSDRGFVGFNVNYRLSPAATFPAHLVDIKRAIAWVREHCDEYGVDPRFVAVTGGSAGAHLAAMAALTVGVARFQPGFEDTDTSVQAAIPLYGVYDLTNRSHRQLSGFLEKLIEPLVIKAFFAEEPEKFIDASPLAHVHADAPPFFVIHGSQDTMAPLADAREFVAALKKVSAAPVLFAEIAGAHHAFDVFVSPRSLPVIVGVGDFLEHLYAEFVRVHGPAAQVAGVVVRPAENRASPVADGPPAAAITP